MKLVPRNNNIWSVFGIMMVVVSLISACAARPAAPMEKTISQSADLSQERSAPASGAPQMLLPAAENENSYSNTQALNSDRMVIKNANLTLIVKDPVKSMDAITQIAEKMGGYVVSANLNQTQSQSGKSLPHASITIRVPAEKLNDTLKEIKLLSPQLPESENIESQDITSQYTDLDSRLRNLKDTEEQLRKIMDQAYSTEDVLSVYNQLTQVREQIEVIEGQMKYYRESAALSSISTELIAEEAVEPLSIAGWKPVGVARDALQALINAMKYIVNIVIWLVIFILPIFIVLYAIFVYPLTRLFRFLGKRRKNQKNHPAIIPPAS
ncbi:MAG: DUF4349 domain-containing protein, partial [Anaerolineales bacterium]